MAIHGNKSQGQRVRALADFKTGRSSVLVATEIAARGLDIDGLPHVVNFELPMVPEDYVHRIGRTGRAGSPGHAVSLVCVDEGKLLREIEVVLGDPIPTEVIAGFEPDRSIRPEPILRGGLGRGRPMQGSRGPRPMHLNSQRPAFAGGQRPGPRPGDDRGGVAPARRPSGAPRYDAGPRPMGTPRPGGPGRPDAPTRPVGQPWVAGRAASRRATPRRTRHDPVADPTVGRDPARDVPAARHTPVSRSAIAPPVDPAIDRTTTAASDPVRATVAVLPGVPRRCRANASRAPRTDQTTRGRGPRRRNHGPDSVLRPRVSG